MSWHRPNKKKRMLPLLDIIPNNIQQHQVWLDTGTGDGLFARLVSSRIPRSTVIKSDISTLSNLKPLGFCASLEYLAIRKCSINGIICSQVLHYVPTTELKDIIKQLISKLEYCGYLFIVEYEIEHPYSWIPFPISINHILSISNKISNCTYIKSKAIQDFNRPKFSILLQKI